MDKYLLKYKMQCKGVNVKKMQKHLGLSVSSFYKKMNGVTQFTRIEIKEIVDYLNLTNEDIINIF